MRLTRAGCRRMETPKHYTLAVCGVYYPYAFRLPASMFLHPYGACVHARAQARRQGKRRAKGKKKKIHGRSFAIVDVDACGSVLTLN